MLEMTAKGECVLIWPYGGDSHFRERCVHRGFTKRGVHRGFTKMGVHRGFTKRGVHVNPVNPPGYGPDYGGSYTSVFLILLGVSLTYVVLCRTVYYFHILLSCSKLYSKMLFVLPILG